LISFVTVENLLQMYLRLSVKYIFLTKGLTLNRKCSRGTSTYGKS